MCERMTASKRVMPFCASVHSSLMWCCQLLMRAKQRETGRARAVICQPAWAVNEGDCGKPTDTHTRTHTHTLLCMPTQSDSLHHAKVCTHFRTHTEEPWLHADKQMDKQQNIHISTFWSSLVFGFVSVLMECHVVVRDWDCDTSTAEYSSVEDYFVLHGGSSELMLSCLALCEHKGIL